MVQGSEIPLCFFFSSRRRHTRSLCDWSSDVCSSDLAYYLKQVVKEWSLGTIYKGMFEFMVLQCIAIALVMFVPAIATWFPQHLNLQSQAVETEDVDDSMNRLEEDPLKGLREGDQAEPEKEDSGKK